MTWQFSPYTIPLIIIAIIGVTWAVTVWPRSSYWLPGRLSIVITLLAAAWTTGDALQLASADPRWMLFWFRVTVLIAVWIAAVWFVLALSFTGHIQRLKNRRWLMLAIMPLIISVLTLLDDRYHLIVTNIQYVRVGQMLYLSYRYGTALNIFALYAYGLQTAAAAVLLWPVIRQHQLHWRQVTTIFAGWLATVGLFLLDQAYQSPAAQPRLLPLSILVVFTVVVGGFNRLRRADFAKVARGNLVDKLPDAVIVVDVRGVVLDLNPQAERVFGCTLEQRIGHPVSELDAAIGRIVAEFLSTSSEQDTAVEVRLNDRVFDLRSASITNWRRKVVGYSIVLRDISERKQMEEYVKQSLHEKEMLLKEIHHRVKNNLQIISSLLSLQSGSIEDPLSLSQFQDSQTRIRSMALIHERLYRSDDLSQIEFGTYLRDLAGSLVQTYRKHSQNVSLSVESDPIMLDIDTAIPCGLIVNELVSNALKHAFPDGRGGEIRIEMQRCDEGQYRLVVRDDGAGMPEGMDFRKTSSLGLQLVNNLAHQLGGTVEMNGGRGTLFTIQFRPSSTSGK